MKARPTIILVHGAFHGAWCWQMVVDHLNKHGAQSIAIDLPGSGDGPGAHDILVACAAHLREAIVASAGPVIVCGHSLGGASITEAVDPSGQVSHLAYLAALVPDVGETAIDNAPEILTGEIGKASRQSANGMIAVDPEAARTIFYHDCDFKIADWAVSQLCPQNPAVSMTPVTQASRHYCESTYVICEQDRALPVPLQERLANRCNNVIRWPTSHSPMLSQPQLVGDFLIELAMKAVD